MTEEHLKKYSLISEGLKASLAEKKVNLEGFVITAVDDHGEVYYGADWTMNERLAKALLTQMQYAVNSLAHHIKDVIPRHTKKSA